MTIMMMTMTMMTVRTMTMMLFLRAEMAEEEVVRLQGALEVLICHPHHQYLNFCIAIIFINIFITMVILIFFRFASTHGVQSMHCHLS